jgi:tetratricopeptide (TPR) repeat protein
VLASSILSYERTVEIIHSLNMEEALGPVYNKLGVAHYEMGNYTEAEKFFKESMHNLYESGNRKEAAMALNNLGNLLYINNKYDDAIDYYERSMASKNETGYAYGTAVTLFNIGNAYRRSGKQEEALKMYERSLHIADSLGIVSLAVKNLKALVSSFEASKSFEKAVEARARLDSTGLQSVSIEIPVSENEMDLEMEKTQEILSMLNEEALKRKEEVEKEANGKVTDLYINNLNNKYAKQQSRSKYLLMLSIGLGMILVLVLVFYRKTTKKAKAA